MDRPHHGKWKATTSHGKEIVLDVYHDGVGWMTHDPIMDVTLAWNQLKAWRWNLEPLDGPTGEAPRIKRG